MADLATLLTLSPDATEQWDWPNVGVRFDVNAYVTAIEPPLELVTSVRAIAFRGDEVFVFDSEGTTHAIPGGHREPGEAPDAALVREIHEEIGCAIAGTPRRLGIFHLRTLTPRRVDQKYPYPDTLQWVFVAEVTGEAIPSGDPFVINGRFVSLDAARALLASVGERVFLDAAVASR